MILVKIWAIIASQAQDMMTKDGLTEPTTEHWAKAKAPFRRSLLIVVSVVNNKILVNRNI